MISLNQEVPMRENREVLIIYPDSGISLIHHHDDLRLKAWRSAELPHPPTPGLQYPSPNQRRDPIRYERLHHIQHNGIENQQSWYRSGM